MAKGYTKGWANKQRAERLGIRLGQAGPSNILPDSVTTPGKVPDSTSKVHQESWVRIDQSLLGNLTGTYEHGIFANRSFEPGSLILTAYPLLERPYDLLDEQKKPTAAFEQYYRDIRQLSGDGKRELLGYLALRRKPYTTFKSPAGLDKKLDAAEMSAQDLTRVELAAVFRQFGFPFYGTEEVHRLFRGHVGLLNHSCIEAGHEILISYIDPYHTREQRHRRLNFDCKCTECNLTGKALLTSDADREKASKLLQHWRAFKEMYFGNESSIIEPTMEEARQLVADDRYWEMAEDVRGGVSGALVSRLPIHSTLALFFEALYVIDYTNVLIEPDEEMMQWAWENKVEEFMTLALCLGDQHPRSQRSCAQLERLAYGKGKWAAELTGLLHGFGLRHD